MSDIAILKVTIVLSSMAILTAKRKEYFNNRAKLALYRAIDRFYWVEVRVWRVEV
jgi:hypothetical protein